MKFWHKIMLLAVLAAMSQVLAARESWHVVLASGEKIPVSEIECMLMAQGANTYDIVLTHDNIVYKDVVRTTFEYCEEQAGAFGVHAGEAVSGPFGDAIVVQGASKGAEIKIYNSAGQCVLTTGVGDGGRCSIDISGLSSGIYVLSTPNSRVKFIKQ